MSKLNTKFVIYTEEDENECEENIGNEEIIDPDAAMISCMREYGRPNLSYLERMTHKSREELIKILELYQNPVSYDMNQDPDAGWLTKEMYIRNKHIPKLYAEATVMQEKYGIFGRNIRLLKELYPSICGLTARDLPIGNRILSNYMYGDIIKEMLSLKFAPDVDYNNDSLRFTVTFYDFPSHVLDHYQYGTVSKGATEIITALMNGEEIVQNDKEEDPWTGKVRYVKNEQETLLLQEKVKVVVNRYFEILSQMLEDPDTYESVSIRYCNTLGGYHNGMMNAEWVSPPGLEVSPYPHQKVGIAKILTQPATMLVWDTGAGKTLVMVAAAAELKRLGISKKILFVIPNGAFIDFVSEAETYYPNANYLIIYPKLFSSKKEYYLELIRNGSYDAIMMASSSYNLIDMSKDYYLDQCDESVRKCKAALASAIHGEDIRILKNKLARLEKKHTELLTMVPKCTNCFEHLGIDCLMIDEAHNYKNVTLTCSYSYISGVTINGSKKCDTNLEKVHHVLKQKDSSEGRVVFATATPLKNSLAEEFVYQCYLQKDELDYLEMNTFKEWMKNFTEPYTKPFISQDIQHLVMKTKLNFHNLTDLHSMIYGFTDFYHIENGTMDLPACAGYRDVVIPATDQEIAKIEEIAEKLRKFGMGEIGPKEYNPLMAAVEGRMLSSDIRLMDPYAVPESGTTKEAFCASEVKFFYEQYPGMTQVIYCDLSVPKETFNVYDELKREMILAGIPEHEIAYIHDAEIPAQKKLLLQAFNEGTVRVLIGSTEKLGTGLNIQRRLVALHHYDCPWSPAQLMQRNGRGIRRGNLNKEIFIVRYLKERSYDAIMWQIVETKMRFISDYNSYTMPESQRDAEDITDSELSYGQAIAHALGNPRLKEHAELKNEVTRTRMEARKRASELQRLQKMIAEIPVELDKEDRYIECLQKDIAYYSKNKTVISNVDRQIIGQRILDAIDKMKLGTLSLPISYQGFLVTIPAARPDEVPFARIKGIGGLSYKVKMDTSSPLGCCMVLDRCLGTSLGKMLVRHEKKCTELVRELNDANREIMRGNPSLKKLQLLSEQLMKLEEELEVK